MRPVTSGSRVFLARWLIAADGSAFEDAALAVEDGRIVGAGDRREVLARGGGRPPLDLGDVVLLPGLVNAHTHLELSHFADRLPAARGFVPWVRELIAAREGDPASVSPGDVAATAAAVARARGTVAVGDVCNDPLAIPPATRTPLLGISFHEVLAFRADRAEAAAARASAALAQAARRAPDWPAVAAAHAPYSCSAPLLERLHATARERRLPFSIHAAESPEEERLLRDGDGPFREFLIERGAWDPGWSPPGTTAIRYLDSLGLVGPGTLLVHAVHIDADEVETIARRGAVVVTCPRSNRRLGVGRCPVGKLVAAGVDVALGTDSLASVESLDPFAEMAALASAHPDLSPAQVLRIATTNGARALGLDDRIGTLRPGRLAHVLAVPVPAGASPGETLCGAPQDVAWLSELA